MSAISQVFCKPALEWSAADLELAIGWYQEHRSQFHLVKEDGELKKPRKPRKAKAVQLDLFKEGSIVEG
jgi:hypothetical protein